ncbi:hypothetical protein MKX08_008998 [Trichoderma sp. CBMAI-0020]|nr:hypothetical protein MKX08_008998 [Trichoderma sp. CBMAI-0020]
MDKQPSLRTDDVLMQATAGLGWAELPQLFLNRGTNVNKQQNMPKGHIGPRTERDRMLRRDLTRPLREKAMDPDGDSEEAKGSHPHKLLSTSWQLYW